MTPSTRSTLAFSLAVLALLLALPAAAQVNLQVIHNSASVGLAEEVDIYVNGALTLDDFAFRTATPFLELPANTDLAVAVAPSSSTSADDAIFSQTFNLPGGAYQLVATGLPAASNYEPNPDGIATGFQLLAGLDALQSTSRVDTVAVRVIHGATDAPTVDILENGVLTFNDLAYTDVSGYDFVDAAPVRLTVTTADGDFVAAYDADLSGAAGAAVTVLASGFLTPLNDRNGPAFGLLAVFADGTTALLPEAGPDGARLQVIHNAPDPAAAIVDVYVNGERLLDDFAFRTATPFVDVPAGTDLSVAVAPGTSSSVADAVYTQVFNLPAGSSTQLVASGVLNPDAVRRQSERCVDRVSSSSWVPRRRRKPPPATRSRCASSTARPMPRRSTCGRAARCWSTTPRFPT